MLSVDYNQINSYLDRDPPLSQLILVLNNDDDDACLTYENLRRSAEFSNLKLACGIVKRNVHQHHAVLKLSKLSVPISYP